MIYLYSKRDIANIIADLSRQLVSVTGDSEWYGEHTMYVTAHALEIWLHRFNHYETWAASIREDAVRQGLSIREGTN